MQVAIIGSGIAGLTAAIEAADRGASVTLFDARRSLGGRARTVARAGFQLNEGAHALYEGGPAMAMLKRLGLEPAGSQPSIAGVAVDGPLVGRLPVGPISLLRTPLLKGDRWPMLKLFAGLSRLDPADYAELTVRQALRRLLGDGPAARLTEALVRLAAYGHDPDRASADAGLLQLQLGNDTGVRYLDGGWQVIVDGLRARAERSGVLIRAGVKVTAVRSTVGAPPVGQLADHPGPAVTGMDGSGQVLVTTEVGTDRTIERFDSVVVAAGGPRQAANLLGDAVPAAARWAADARPARAASLDVGLSAPWGDHPTFALGIDEPLYLSVHAPVADLAPEGHTLVHVMRYQHPDEAPDSVGDAAANGSPGPHRAACEALLDRVRPGWRDDAVHIGFRPNLVAATDQPSADRGGLGGRPPVAVADAPGVFLAGDWVGDTGVLVDASTASGLQAGRLAATAAPHLVGAAR
ncbi:MAG: FAD-dependent oxidoreductase [Actinomycetota bacterium]